MNPALSRFEHSMIMRNLSVNTIRVYCAYLSPLFNRFPIDALTLDQVQSVQGEMSSSSQRVFRAAWQAWCRYAQAEEGKTYPELPTARVAPSSMALDIEIAGIIEAVTARIPLRRVEHLKWADVRGAGGELVQIIDTSGGHSHFAPLQAIKDLRKWAQPPSPEAPLIPMEPGSMTPMASGVVKTQIVREKHRRLREGPPARSTAAQPHPPPASTQSLAPHTTSPASPEPAVS